MKTLITLLAISFSIQAASASDMSPEFIKQYTEVTLENMRLSFKDPDAVKIESYYYKNAAVCGVLNAKNGFGAYTGRQRFLASDFGALVILEHQDKLLLTQMWDKFCAK